MNARQFEQELESIFDELKENSEVGDAMWSRPFGGEEIRYFRTFEDASLLTHNKGIVITFENGDEFHLTIVQSQYGEGTEDDYDEEEDEEWN